jgi:hypothetical protein
MKKLSKFAIVFASLAALGGCAITPPSIDYIGPRVEFVRPGPYYAPAPYYAPYYSQRRHGYRHWD